jgi:lipoyl(octanoyl) transferase
MTIYRPWAIVVVRILKRIFISISAKNPLLFWMIYSKSLANTFETSSPRRRCGFYNLDRHPYREVWTWQQSLVEARRENPTLEDILILVEHPPVYTLGKGASLEFLKFDPTDREIELYRVERGGEVTYHCPGQIVGYPILNLRYYQMDLHWYLRQLEEVILQVLAEYGLKGDRLPGFTGVWLEGRKVAAIGIKVSRWITMHGFALNVCPDLQGFEQIVPCGIANKPVGSLAEFIPGIEPEKVRVQIATAFANTFGVELSELKLPTQGE